MNALIYLKKRTMINGVKKAIRTPKVYFFLALIVFYCIMMISFFTEIAEDIGNIGPENFVALITMLIFLTLPTSIISYIKRKGIVFKKADIHFAFQSPISPKTNLVFAKINAFLLSFIIGIIFGVVGLLVFHTAIVPTILYSIFLMALEPIFEGALIILIYGNEVLSEKVLTILKVAMYIIIGAFVVGILINLIIKGFSLETLNQLLFSPWVLGIPVVGWSVAIANVLFLGPKIFSVIFTICYFAFFVLVVIMAKKMKCNGGYYEDAMKFADDYEEARTRGKRGEITRIGKKRKYKKAEIIYKGKYAKAIFYRQVLEYKKNKFFIFGGRTLLIIILAIGLSILFSFENVVEEAGEYAVYIIPGIMLYIDLIFSGYITKWGRELTNANLFLIPDTAVRKLWYATLTEHMRAFVDALILTIPIAIVLKLSILQMLLIIIVCVLIQAIKLYVKVFIHGIFRESIGVLGKQMLQLLFYGIILSIAIIPTIFISIGLGVEFGFLVFIGITIFLTGSCMLAASEFFKRMEAVG